MEQEIIKAKREWYGKTYVKLEIVKCLKERELCFIDKENKNTTRALLGTSLDYFDKHIKRWEVMDKPVNLYHSVATLKDMPIFSYNLNERTKTKEYIEFKDNFAQYVTGYNFFIDIDGKDEPHNAYAETFALKTILDGYKVPYYIMNSSFTGFHIHIPSEYMPKMPINELIELIRNVQENIKGIHSFKFMDTSITDLRRVCKVPYSFVNDGSICLPLNGVQFINFRKDMVEVEKVKTFIHIKNRGLNLRTHGLSDVELRHNVEKFLEEYI